MWDSECNHLGDKNIAIKMSTEFCSRALACFLVLVCVCGHVRLEQIRLPSFFKLKSYYPGYYHHGGPFRNHKINRLLGIEDSSNILLNDTSALRLSYAFNEIGGQHSIGSDVIRLSKYGTDSVPGRNGLQYIFHPLAFGPYLADKYGYPTVTKMHLFDPVKTKESFNDKQGVMRVITYMQHDNEPKGHVGLWDCNGFFQARDFFEGHTLLSVEFWESPDTDCSSNGHMNTQLTEDTRSNPADSDDIDSHILSILKKKNMRHEHRKHKNNH